MAIVLLILASQSKARRTLLQQLSIEHKVIPSYIDEDQFANSDIKELVRLLSFAKAQLVVSNLIEKTDPRNTPKEVAVLGCDSLFEFNGKVFAKPKNSQEAISRLQLMSSHSGTLHTGHCLLYRKKVGEEFRQQSFKGIVQDVVSTRINFGTMSEKDIVQYVATGEPLNCAGGFAIESKGSFFIESIDGCYSNVIGLSLPWLRKALRKASIPYFV